MPVQGLDPQRAVEVIGPQYGSGYRIGGRLVLTVRHVFANAPDATCRVRARHTFGEVAGQVVWQAPAADVALVALPETVPECGPVPFGRLPEPGHSAMTLPFECYGWPKWAQTTPPDARAKAGGRLIPGMIYLADTSPEGFLVVEPFRRPDVPEPGAQDSPWAGVSGAAVLCHGLIVAVQHQHQNPRRAASLEAELLSRVYEDPDWRRLLAEHQVPCDPVALLAELPEWQQKYRNDVIKEITAKLKALQDNERLRKVAREIQQLPGNDTLKDAFGKDAEDLATLLATCMVEHRAVTEVVGCLIHLMDGLSLEHANTIADVIDLLLPFNYAPDVLGRLRTQLTHERFGLVEATAATLTLAEIIMAGYDRQPTRFTVMTHGQAGLRGVTALTPPWAPPEGPEDPDSEAMGVLRATRDFLYDLLGALEVVPTRSPHLQGEAELQQEIAKYARSLRARLQARRTASRRTMYCVVPLPKATPQRDFRTQILRAVARALHPEDTVLVFVEWMAEPEDEKEEVVDEYLRMLHKTLHTRYVRTF